ncbi:MAG: amino acid adenylation domain-containing protein, partial [bacterium]|nr:amino acid adenylation domain-containing protein [bacterium]
MTEIFKRPTLRQLSEFLTEALEVKYSSILPAEPKEYYPQSSAQRRLYFLHQLDEGDVVYNIQMMDIYCKGVEKDKLEEAFKKLIKRHESLRTSFHMIDGKAMQKIHNDVPFEIEYYETTEEGLIYGSDHEKEGHGENSSGESFEEVIKRFVRPFELSEAPLFRAGFIKIVGNTKILMLDMHHIVSDGISMEILAKELWELYDGKEFQPLRIQYKDFSEWLGSEARVDAIKEQENFWLNEFSGEIPLISLPTDYPRPAKLTFDGDTAFFEITSGETKHLHAIANEHAESLYMVLFAAFNVLLSKLSGQEDIVVGTVTAGRGHADLESIVGMFLNTLALRNYPEVEKSFEDFLMEVKLSTFAAFENQNYPFEQLVSKVAPREETGRNPLFDVAFGLENEADPTGYLMEVAVPDKSKPFDFEINRAKFDLTLGCVEVEDCLECTIEYKTKLFKQETIQRIAGYFMKIISSICSDISQQISDIEIISEEEREKILYEFNQTNADYPGNTTIHELFEKQVENTPNNTALAFRDDKLTYSEFNEKANQLAVILRDKGVKPDQFVGLMLERSLEMMIGMFAILKAGGAYLPIDPEYPGDRILYLLQDSDSRILLTEKKFIGTTDFEGEAIDLRESSLYRGDGKNLELVNTPQSLAYAIYTSGSTGKPKGVMIEHWSVLNMAYSQKRTFEIGETDNVLQFSSVSFDASVEQIYITLLSGASLVLVDKMALLDMKNFEKFIDDQSLAHIHAVPLFVGTIPVKKYKNLKRMVSGGDVCPKSLVQSWTEHCDFCNEYGPTETTVTSIQLLVRKGEELKEMSIGKALDNTYLYVLDKKLKPVPIGVPGELYIGGDGVARGYLNRPELTPEVFTPDLFVEGGRMYKSGDLVRWLSDGNMDFMGRIDNQVKIRGFRIELGEIETQLLNLEEIDEVCVIARDDSSGVKYLCAYIIACKSIDSASIKERLLVNLPDYMVPSYFVQLDTFPKTPSGKLDRKALPEPEMTGGGEYIAPTNETEEALEKSWSEVLGMEKVSIEDNFFEIGGDSIKTILISARLRKLNLSVSINDFFSNPTISQLAKYVKKIERKIEQGEVSGKIELTPVHYTLLEKDPAAVHHFNHVVTQFSKDRFDEEILKKVFTKIIQHHDALRTVYKSDGDKITQKNRSAFEGKLFDMEVFDLKDKQDFDKELEEETNRLNSSIDLQTGPLVKLGLFKTNKGDYLKVIVHHAVVDGISWRVIGEDFEIGYEQAEKGEELKFQDKSDSFKDWASKLKEYADSPKALKELSYWKSIEETVVEKLPAGREAQKETQKYKNQASISMSLDKEKTDQLLNEAGWVYNTEINDLFLTVLALALNEWSGKDKILINLEGHGREGIIEDIDFSRTVGWFTTQYPVLFDMKPSSDKSEAVPAEEELAHQIRQVKETLRRIPNKGIGYGILNYLTSPENKEGTTFKLHPEVSFNYLGQLTEESGDGGRKFNLDIELSASSDCDTSYAIDINGSAGADGLSFSFAYDTYRFDEDSVEAFVNYFKTNLLK